MRAAVHRAWPGIRKETSRFMRGCKQQWCSSTASPGPIMDLLHGTRNDLVAWADTATPERGGDRYRRPPCTHRPGGTAALAIYHEPRPGPRIMPGRQACSGICRDAPCRRETGGRTTHGGTARSRGARTPAFPARLPECLQTYPDSGNLQQREYSRETRPRTAANYLAAVRGRRNRSQDPGPRNSRSRPAGVVSGRWSRCGAASRRDVPRVPPAGYAVTSGGSGIRARSNNRWKS